MNRTIVGHSVMLTIHANTPSSTCGRESEAYECIERGYEWGWLVCMPMPLLTFCGIGMSCFRLKREKIRAEMGKDTYMHAVLQNMELRTIFGFKPGFERGKRL